MKRGVDPLVPLLGLSAILCGLIVLQLRARVTTEQPTTPLGLSVSTHRLEVFFLVYVFRAIEPALQLRRKTLRAFPRGGTPSPDLESVPRRRHYCLANFLAMTLNARSPPVSLFVDLPNSHALKRALDRRYDLINTGVFSGSARRRRWEWDPRAGLFLSAADLSRSNDVGISLLGVFQMASAAPGSAALHRLDALLDAGAAQKRCFNLRAHLPRVHRLYDREECKAFFTTLRSNDFKTKMRTQTVFLLHDAEAAEEFPLDWPRARQLNRQYQQGALCGRNQRKLLAIAHFPDVLRRLDGGVLKLRVFAHYASTIPVLLYFHPGVVVAEMLNGKEDTVSTAELSSLLASRDSLVRIYEEIKRIVARINHLSMQRLLPDARFFQSIAFDFVLRADFRPLLVAAASGVPLKKAYSEVHEAVVSLQREVLNERNERVRVFTRAALHQLNKAFSARAFDSFEQAAVAMEANLPRRVIRAQFREVFRNALPVGRIPPGLELIFDGTAQGAARYRGLLSAPCAA